MKVEMSISSWDLIELGEAGEVRSIIRLMDESYNGGDNAPTQRLRAKQKRAAVCM